MNATVCGDINHGEQKAVHDRWQRSGKRGAGRQEKEYRPGETGFFKSERK
jgi:hypothetical protein